MPPMTAADAAVSAARTFAERVAAPPDRVVAGTHVMALPVVDGRTGQRTDASAVEVPDDAATRIAALMVDGTHPDGGFAYWSGGADLPDAAARLAAGHRRVVSARFPAAAVITTVWTL